MEKITNEEIINSLNRSGYLLENRVLNTFLKKEFWAESSHHFLVNDEDKHREIDVLAFKVVNSYTYENSFESISLHLNFVCECINSPQPLGLFKNVGDNEETTSDWNYLFINGSSENRESNSINWRIAIEKLEHKMFNNLPARQYCGFTEKKNSKKSDIDRWMANHPDDFHQNLTKLALFIKQKNKETIDSWEGRRPSMGRLELFIPLIILPNEIIEITCEKEISLSHVNYYKLKVPFEKYFNKSLSIDIVKEEFLERYLEQKINLLDLMFNFMTDNDDNTLQ